MNTAGFKFGERVMAGFEGSDTFPERLIVNCKPCQWTGNYDRERFCDLNGEAQVSRIVDEMKTQCARGDLCEAHLMTRLTSQSS